MNKNYLIIGVLITVLLIIAIFFFLPERKKSQEELKQPTPTPSAALAPIEEEVEVSLVKKKGVEEVTLTISSIPEDISSIDYELTYLTQQGLPRGVLGKISIKKDTKVSRDITLGTCSRNVCVYDRNVNKISLALKFTGEKGTRGYKEDFEF